MRADPAKYVEHLPGRPDGGAVRPRLPALPRQPDRAGALQPAVEDDPHLRGRHRLQPRRSRRRARRRLRTLGWEIVGIEPIAGTAGPVTDWTPMIAKAKESGAAVVFNTHWNPADHAALMKQWAADPPDAFLYLQYGASVPEFLEIAGDSANGVVWATVLGTMNDASAWPSRSATRRSGARPAGFSNAGTGLRRGLPARPRLGHHGRPAELRGQHRRAQAEHLPRRLGRLLVRARRRRTTASPTRARSPDPSLGNPHLFFQILPDDERGPRAPDHPAGAVHPGAVRAAAVAELLGG